MCRRKKPSVYDVVVIPARSFLNQVIILQSFVPEGIYLEEGTFVGSVFDKVLNNLDTPVSDLAQACFNYTPYADSEDVQYIRSLLVENLDYFSDLLRLAIKDANRYLLGYNYADLMRISWDTKSIFVKVL